MEFIEENIIEWDSMNCCILATDYLYPLFPQQNGSNVNKSIVLIKEQDNIHCRCKQLVFGNYNTRN